MFGCNSFTFASRRSFQTCIFNRVKSETVPGKDEVGKAIRKSNKENKILFGKLLETRPQKRKNKLAKKHDLQAGDLNISNSKMDASSELWWWKRSSQSRITQLRIKRDDSKSASQSESGMHQLDPQNGTEKVQVKEKLSPILSDVKESIDSEVSVVKDLKVPLLKLPDIIVKNITSFPLRNNNNLESDQIDTNILSISAKDESDVKRKTFLSYPAVTRILSATMSESSKAALRKWQEKLTAELGEDGFLAYQEGLLSQGRKFHSIVQDYLMGTPANELALDPTVEGCWESMETVLPDVSGIRVLESHVVHPALMYRGVIDCVGEYRGKPVLIEWKKSDKQKLDIRSTYDAPLQLAAYLGAMNYDEQYNLSVQGGLVVVAYTDGSPAHVFKLNLSDCTKYWALWLSRLQKYWQMQ